MAYQNFIPTVWNTAINRELEKSLVFAENTNRQYEGDVRQQGDSVRILGVGKPTITRTTDKNIELTAAEKVEDTSITMPISQIAYFNYKVDDIDKRQAVKGVMDALSAETSQGLADEVDKYIAKLATAREAVKLDEAATLITKDNILEYIDRALERLYMNNVRPSSPITATVDPTFYMRLKQAYTKLDTDNSGMMKNGRVGMYGNVTIKMSNNVADTGGTKLIQLKTDRAIAYVKPMTHTEAYRPENGFSDAVKGFILFDAKIVRPKEMIVLNAKYK
ncbi:MAG: hypothetical protein RR424_08905 [Oscillospiraceae bacterium]